MPTQTAEGKDKNSAASLRSRKELLKYTVFNMSKEKYSLNMLHYDYCHKNVYITFKGWNDLSPVG